MSKKQLGWQEIPTKDGAMWFGVDWESKRNILGLINKTIDVSDAMDTIFYRGI
jgi:hypothetical protein